VIEKIKFWFHLFKFPKSIKKVSWKLYNNQYGVNDNDSIGVLYKKFKELLYATLYMSKRYDKSWRSDIKRWRHK